MFDYSTLIILLTIMAVIMFFMGVSMVLVFSFWAIGFTYITPAFIFANMPHVAYETLDVFALTAVPLFIVIGTLISVSGLADDIVAFSRSVSGWLRGSTANTSIFMCGVLSAITGSNAATTAAVGEALHDKLEEEGYPPTFAAATIASGGTLGIIIPPSVLFILYGAMFSVSIRDLFIAGIIPGIGMLIGLIGVCTYISYRNDYGTVEYKFSPKNIAITALQAKIAIGAIIVLLGGIYTGIFTPAESGAAAFFFLAITLYADRSIGGASEIIYSSKNAIALTGIIIPIFVATVFVQQGLSFVGLQDVIANMIQGLGTEAAIILALIVILLISGSLLDSVPNMILVAPILSPVAFELGISPVMWGVLFMMSDAIGFITPPYGLNLFVISSITDIDYIEVAYAALPYLISLVLIWVVFLIYPDLNWLAP